MTKILNFKMYKNKFQFLVNWVERTFLIEKIPNYQTRIQIVNVMKMRGLKNVLFITTEYTVINFRIPSKTIDGSQVIISFTRHVYIIEGFKPKILVKDDILKPELVIPDFGKKYLTIGSCKNISIKFNVKNIGPPIKRMVGSNGIIKISAKSSSVIPFRLRGKNDGLSTGRDFMFIQKKN